MIDIEDYKPMIIKLAYSLSRDFADDLIEVGITKLLTLEEKYDITKNTKFSTYAYSRIKGAMKDTLRHIQWFNRNQKDLSMVYISDLDEDLFIDDSENLILLREKTSSLLEAVDSLPRRQRELIKLYYWNGMSFFEIACFFGISDSRVSQLHKQALSKLKEKLSDTKE